MQNQNEEIKGPLRNFNFSESADKRLLELKQQTGKTMTMIIEDLLLGRRQFEPEVEKFISEQMQRYNQPRHKVIEAALIVAMKGFSSTPRNPAPEEIQRKPEAVRPTAPRVPPSRKVHPKRRQ